MTESNHNKLHHHIAMGAGFLGLIAWYYFGRYSGFLDWIILQVPERFAGSALMLGIMIMMTPGFFIWTRYNRWIEKRLNVKGRYYEDEYYKNQKALKSKEPSDK